VFSEVKHPNNSSVQKSPEMTTSPKDSTASRDWAGTDISISDNLSAGPSPTDIAISDHPFDDYAPLDGLAPGSREAQERQSETVEKLNLPLEIFSKVVGIRFRLIPAGTFVMGSPENEESRYKDEGPQHQVTISRPFFMGTFQVTQAQWQKVMGSNPSYSKGDDLPVEQVSWNYCQEYLQKLCEIEGVPKETYRLPTEAEWEYACRAGTTTRFYTGDNENDLARAGWYDDNSGDKTNDVGQKAPNAFGLYDIHGNVWEWCEDWYAAYASENVTDPRGPAKGSNRVFRGGSWYGLAGGCRSAGRCDDIPDFAYDLNGFRLVMPAGQ